MPPSLPTLDKLRHETLALLLDSGYVSPLVDIDGHVRFQSDGLTFRIVLDDVDPEYVRFSLPNFYHGAQAQDEMLMLAVANDCQRRFKLGEYAIADGWVSVEVPLLMDDSRYLTTERLFRLTQSLRTMAQAFVTLMQTASATRGT